MVNKYWLIRLRMNSLWSSPGALLCETSTRCDESRSACVAPPTLQSVVESVCPMMPPEWPLQTPNPMERLKFQWSHSSLGDGKFSDTQRELQVSLIKQWRAKPSFLPVDSLLVPPTATKVSHVGAPEWKEKWATKRKVDVDKRPSKRKSKCKGPDEVMAEEYWKSL